MKLIRITGFNLKKKMGTVVILFVLTALATMFMSVGMNIASAYSNIYEKNKEFYEEPDNLYLMGQKMFKEEYVGVLEQDEDVDRVELTRPVVMESAKIVYQDGNIELPALFLNMDEDNGMLKANIREEIQTDAPESVYIPASLQQYGFNPGDEITFEYKGNHYYYTVAGITETTSFGIINSGTLKFYLKAPAYESLTGEVGRGYLLSAKLKAGADAELVNKRFTDYIKENANSSEEAEFINSITAVNSKLVISTLGNMVAGIVVGFSVVLVIITLLVVRFRIINSIMENMTQIGVLEALGYKQREVIMIYILEYLGITITGVIAGIIGSYCMIPMLGRLLSDMNGMRWMNSLHLIQDLQCVALMMMAMFVISYSNARKVLKYPPVTALSKGTGTHSFRKNRFSLKKCRNITVWIALKEMGSSLKQNIMVVVCVMCVTFATMMGLYLYFAFGVDDTTIKKVANVEWTDVSIYLNQTTDEQQFLEEIRGMDMVRKAALSKTYIQMYAQDEAVYINIYDDFARLETVAPYEGRNPEYKNEIVVTGTLAKRWHKQIGDMITVEYNGSSADYMICGLSQTFSNGGRMLSLSYEGIKELCPSFRLDTVDVYLKDHADTDEFIKQINTIYGMSAEDAENGKDNIAETRDEKIKRIADEKIARLMKTYGVENLDYSIMIDGKIISGNTRRYAVESVEDFEKYMNSNMNQFEIMFSMIAYVLLGVTMLIIGLMLTFIINSILMQKRMKYGIYKALGFTSRQTAAIITGSLMPAVITGVIMGTILNHFSISRLMNLALDGIGISRMEFHISPIAIVGLSVFLMVYSFIIAMLYAGKVKNISPYELMTE